MVDYVLMRKCERKIVKNIRVIQSESCLPQHKLILCEVKFKESIKKKTKASNSKCKIWKLKEKDKQRMFQQGWRLKQR